MGLREKALRFLEDADSASALALKPFNNQITANADIEDWEKETLDEMRKEGKINRGVLVYPDKNDTSLSAQISGDSDHLHTMPVESGINQQGRIEALLNMLELCKELGFAEHEEDLWSTLLYGLIGQIGLKEAAIFLINDERPELKAVKGFIIEDDFQLPKRSGIVRVLQDRELHYAPEVISRLAGKEKIWLESLGAELVVPILRYDELMGFVLAGRPVGTDEFHIDDLLYLKIFGEIIGSYFESIQRIIKFSQQHQKWQERENRFAFVENFMRNIEEADNLAQAAAGLKALLKETYHMRMYCFLTRDRQMFVPAVQEGLKAETIKDLNIPVTAGWVWEARHQKDWYKWEDFRNDPDFSHRFSLEDMSLTSDLYLLPIFFHHELQGLFIFFQLNEPLPREDLPSLSIAIKHWFAYFYNEQLLSRSENSLKVQLKDPLYSLRQLADEFEFRLQQNQIPYACLSVQISNSGRLSRIMDTEEFNTMKHNLRKWLVELAAEDAYVAEIFPSHLLMLQTGLDRKQAWTLIKELQALIRRKYPDEAGRPLLRSRIMSRPEDKLTELDNFLFE